MNTKSKNIAQMAAALADDPNMEQAVQDEIARNSMVSCLLSMRVSKKLSQEQVAESMGCHPSKVSRIESGSDRTLKWTDILLYASALNVSTCVLFEDPSLPAAERIKQCVFSIREHLNKLTELAGKVGANDEIAKKIHQFSGEVLFNFLVQYQDHSKELRSVIKLPPHPKATLAVCGPESVSSKDVEEEPVGA